MRSRAIWGAALLMALAACKPAEESHSKAIVGAVLIDGAGGPPLTNSAVVIAGERIIDVGRHGEFPLPEEAAKIDGSGRFLIPELVDVYPREESGALRHVWPARMKRDEFDAAMDAARAAGIPIAGHPATQAEAQLLAQNGARVLIGMIANAAIDPAFAAQLRDLRIIYAPALSSITAAGELAVARQNTALLFAAGVPLAVAAGGDPVRECEAMAQAGVPPLDAIVAATRNGALALSREAGTGTLRRGKRANLLLLGANPGEDIANLRRVDRRMHDGEWVK